MVTNETFPKGVEGPNDPIRVFSHKLNRTITIPYYLTKNTKHLRKMQLAITDERMPNRVSSEDQEVAALRARLKQLEAEKAAAQGYKPEPEDEGFKETDLTDTEVAPIETDEKENDPNDEPWRTLNLANLKSYAKGLDIEFEANIRKADLLELVESYHQNK